MRKKRPQRHVLNGPIHRTKRINYHHRQNRPNRYCGYVIGKQLLADYLSKLQGKRFFFIEQLSAIYLGLND